MRIRNLAHTPLPLFALLISAGCMTLRYAHLSPALLRTAVDRLDGLTQSAPAKSLAAADAVGHTSGHTVLKSGPSAA